MISIHTIVFERGQLLDDVMIDFGDARGRIGFARMTPAERTLLAEVIPERTYVTLHFIPSEHLHA